MEARAGEQTGEAQKKFSNLIPVAAMRSRLGRVELVVAGAGHSPRALVVAEDEDDVWGLWVAACQDASVSDLTRR